MQINPTGRPDSGPGGTEEPDLASRTTEQPGAIARWVQSLLQMGLGELLVRAVTNIFSIGAIVIVIWLARAYFSRPSAQAQTAQDPLASGASLPTEAPSLASLPIDLSAIGISRQAELHTNVPSRPRTEITTYTVQKGDTVSGIADKYGLEPKTIFAANYELLQDNPESLQPGQQLKILPVDGVYWEWLGGIPFGEWAA